MINTVIAGLFLALLFLAPTQAFSSPPQRSSSSTSKMSPTTTNDDKWAATADLYSAQAARLTELHGADLIMIIKDDIVKNSKTIVDIGCGTGAFCKAYLQIFPQGIPGQTIILSDLSPAMLEQAKTSIQPGPDCQTKFVFQVEDGTKLEGVADSSVDLAVSLFGVFLIPDQESTLKAIQRVLKPNGILANASWMFDIKIQGFGVGLQDAFIIPNQAIKPDQQPPLKWKTKDEIQAMFDIDNSAISVEVYHALHNHVGEFDVMWTMLGKNPCSAVNGASEEEKARAKTALGDFLLQNGATSLHKPIMFVTASNLSVVRGFGST